MRHTLTENYDRATALSYAGDSAPRVVATGTGEVAAAIERLARAHRIPVLQDPALSELVASVSLGEEVPPQLYFAVATVMAYVFEVSGRRPAGDPQAEESGQSGRCLEESAEIGEQSLQQL